MRKIKFRAWDCLQEKMYDAVWAEETPYGDVRIVTSAPVCNKTTALMQYTGLKDKNGKEIYEGDILHHRDNYEPYMCVMEWNTEDVGSCGCCWPAFQGVGFVGKIFGKTKYDYSSLASDYDKMEIIGNVHEHPELLEKK
jgi:uncharacterized phage protein (TIGR01671 family)